MSTKTKSMTFAAAVAEPSIERDAEALGAVFSGEKRGGSGFDPFRRERILEGHKQHVDHHIYQVHNQLKKDGYRHVDTASFADKKHQVHVYAHKHNPNLHVHTHEGVVTHLEHSQK